MSINTLPSNSITNPRRDLPQIIPAVGNQVTPPTYVRPADWPALSSLTSTLVFSGLYAVDNTSMEYVAIQPGSVPGTSQYFIGNGTTSGTTGNILVNTADFPTNVTIGSVVIGTGVTAGTVVSSITTAQFVCSTSNNGLLSVSSIISGTIEIGMSVTGLTGMYITAQNSGTPGGVGVYAISIFSFYSGTSNGKKLVVNNTQSLTTRALTVADTYTIDWGDGTTTDTYSGQIVQKQYDYATLSTSVTSRGYKTALINVSTANGIFTAFSLQQRPTPNSPNNALPSGWGAKWLDLQIGSSNLTSLFLSGTTVPFILLEQASVTSVNNSLFNSLGNLFRSCFKLQSCPTLNFGGLTVTRSAGSMFQDCKSLSIAPTFDTSKILDMSNMFLSCVKLQTIPSTWSFAGCTGTSSMFSGCTSLRTMPNLNYSTVLSTSSMFVNCTNLETVPTMTISPSATNLNNMFQNCISLKIAPMINNTQNVIDTSSMFNGCFSLATVPLYDTSKVTSATNMFINCQSLQSLPGPWNFTLCGNFTGMFQGCYNLVACPQLLTSTTALTNVQGMFQLCYALKTVPPFNTNAVTTWMNMFQGCQALVVAPTLNTSNGSNVASMFQNCFALKTIPTYNTINVSSFFSMFNSCRSLQTIPSLNTSNGTNMNSMFISANNLLTVSTLDFTKSTNAGSIFNGCSSLTDVSNIINTSNVINLNAAFQSCQSLNSLPPAWDTAKVTDWANFVNGANALTSIPTYNTSNAINVTQFAVGANSLTIIPALNFQNATSAGFMFTGLNTTRINVSNLKISHNITSTSVGQIELQNYFANLGSNTTAQALTITNIPGATPVLLKTSGITAGSNVITMANTVGVLAGSYLYGIGVNTSIPVIFTDATDTVAYSNGGGVNGLANGDNVIFTSISLTTGIVINTPYFVVNRTSTTFQVSATLGGVALAITGGSGVMSIGGATISNQVLTVNANANVIINGVCGSTNATASLNNRALNQNYATTKNWGITG